MGLWLSNLILDFYGLGCLLHFLLTGKALFEADTSMRLLLQHVQTIPLPPSARATQYIPREIDEIVMQCLEKDPVIAQSPQSVRIGATCIGHSQRRPLRPLASLHETR